MLPGMSIAVLGPVTVDGDDAGLAPRERVVLGVLAVRRGEVVSADALADALWDQEPPPSWAKVVQGCISRLRRALGPGAIETHGQGYRLALPAEQVDAARFERLVVRARELLDLGEPDRAAYAVEDALGLWGGGRPWPELEAWEPAEVEAVASRVGRAAPRLAARPRPGDRGHEATHALELLGRHLGEVLLA